MHPEWFHRHKVVGQDILFSSLRIGRRKSADNAQTRLDRSGEPYWKAAIALSSPKQRTIVTECWSKASLITRSICSTTQAM